ncbi:MAG: cytochrome c biogenesis protein CcdA [Methylococcales bacterium]|nr:cytochrome c biogenesis protein CcdA [Methylococcales bacterium]
MKNNLLIFTLWLGVISFAFADAPTAEIKVKTLNATIPAQFEIDFTVPSQHHAYLDKGEEQMYIPITFDANGSLAGAGLKIDDVKRPAGVYDEEVKATVLRDTGKFDLTISGTPNAASFPLAVKYQICNDVTHQCFRPQTVSVDLPFSNVSAAKKVEPESNESFTDKLLSLFKNNKDNVFIMFGLMLLAGMLSVATPCVYPMLPITSMFIVGRANGVAAKEKQHALVYVIGIVCTYMLLGLMAGMTGGAFNTFMQSGWVNLAFALFFTFFAIALLGFYELGFMQNEVHQLDQKSSNVGGLTGTFLMGSVAGLVISPCVGPIVFALLLQVADNIADKAAALALLNQTLTFADKFTISLQGSFMMAGFGLGVGLPFFLVSVVKFKKLPRAGYWMNKIKYAFGFLILYFAYAYLNKAMGVFGVEPQTTLILTLGVVAIWISVVHCNVLSLLPSDAQPNHKFTHFIGAISLLIGGWLIVAGFGHLPILKSPIQNACATEIVGGANANSLVETEAGIDWYRSFDAAQKLAQQTGKPIFIDFYASWCANCVEFKKSTETNAALNEALRTKAVAVKLVDKEPEFEKFRENSAHRQLKIGLPYFAILKPDGSVLWSGTDYQATEKMISVLNTNNF